MKGEHESLNAYRVEGLLPEVDPEPPSADSDAVDHKLGHAERLGTGEAGRE